MYDILIGLSLTLWLWDVSSSLPSPPLRSLPIGRNEGSNLDEKSFGGPSPGENARFIPRGEPNQLSSSDLEVMLLLSIPESANREPLPFGEAADIAFATGFEAHIDVLVGETKWLFEPTVSFVEGKGFCFSLVSSSMFIPT